MKKLLTLSLPLVFALNANSQIAVTAGASYSKWQDEYTSYRGGFYAGAIYSALADTVPFYIGAGALMLNRGVNLDGADDYGGGAEYKFRTSLYSLHVPADFGFKMSCWNDHMKVVPRVGLYADMGLFGKISQSKEVSYLGGMHLKSGKFDGLNPYTELSDKEKGGIQNFSRFDWGARAGLDAYLSKQVYLSFTYEYGFNKVFNTPYFKSKFSSFHVGLSYLFQKPKREEIQIIEI